MKYLVMILLVLGTATVLVAQAPPPPTLLPPPAQAPIDGGLGLLAAAGAGYAWRRLKKRT